ncbi:ankyrin repeat domain-containing protein [Shimazuella kribbensis]|uniref:ankyrin repeat domain-containing protein n=1 Tax=Shimazuella kribbensis TaxID=139808 RepID=UPI00048B5F26|nr:ankyrin repeat domain-containing protein [Shimazuella kribbensis]
MYKWVTLFICCVFVVSGCSWGEKKANKEVNTMEYKLFQAVEHKDGISIKELVTEGVSINTRDSKGQTPLMLATYNQDASTAKILIDLGADVNIQDNKKNNPFLYAGAEGYLDILKMAIDAEADPTITNRYGGTALIPASEHGYVDVVRELLTRTKINVNHINNLGWTALLEAIILNDGNKQQQQTVQLLIDHGADVNLADQEGVTPLQHARDKGYMEIVKILQNAGAK